MRQGAVILGVARLDTPGLLHRVMIRGIERGWIFNYDEDRENLLERLSHYPLGVENR